MTEKLALFGGPKAVTTDPGDIFTWPIITKEHEDAIIQVLRDRSMSGLDITKKFEEEYSKWEGSKYALGFSSGTAAIQSALYGCKVGVGDEVIMPSITYWGSGLQAYSLGATIVFAEVDPDTLCIDPDDIERKISDKTKAIVAVHYMGYPADMDRIMAIGKKYGIKVVEDVSHAHGALYKGRKVGTIGDVAGYSLMSGKSFAIGEGGILTTSNREIYERAVAFGHYARYNTNFIETDYLKEGAGLPLGGYKYRMHQMSSAVGLVQIKYYDAQVEKIQEGMNYFWDLLEGVPGVKAHRPAKDSGSTMGGWYAAHGLYREEELGGLSVTTFCKAVRAEGCSTSPGCNLALHTHPLFQTIDVYGHGKPTRIANASRDVRKLDDLLPISEKIGRMTYSIPWFKHMDEKIIKEHAEAFKKAALNYKELLKIDEGNPPKLGGFNFFRHSD